MTSEKGSFSDLENDRNCTTSVASAEKFSNKRFSIFDFKYVNGGHWILFPRKGLAQERRHIDPFDVVLDLMWRRSTIESEGAQD